MKTSVFLFVVAAFFVVAFAQEDDDESPDVDRTYMIKYCQLLIDNGYLDGIVKANELESKNLGQLIDIAIKANRVAIEKNPKAKAAKEVAIEFLVEQKEKLGLGPVLEPESTESTEPATPTEPTTPTKPATPTKPTKPTENKEEKNFFAKGIQKLMDVFKGIF